MRTPNRGNIAPLWILLFLCILQTPAIRAIKQTLTENDEFMPCQGMYSKSAIPNGKDPYISLSFTPESKGKVSTLFFEWSDYDNLGKVISDNGDKLYFCDNRAVRLKACTEKQLGSFIGPDESQLSSIQIKDFQLDPETSKSPTVVQYPIPRTGYYCVSVRASEGQFKTVVDWINPFGQLASYDYPKLPLYGLLAVVYLLIGILWLIGTIRYWSEILPVQNYISGLIAVITLEMSFTFGYWQYYNNHGTKSIFLLILSVILNAGRDSLSFFVLLIVCLGYCVVKPSLGSTMKKCIILSVTHFIFGCLYATSAALNSTQPASFIVLVTSLPLALVFTTFYVWILQGLTNTMQTLIDKKQSAKLAMYRWLWRLLVFSGVVLVLFFVINVMNFRWNEDPDWASNHWQMGWFLMDGYLNVLYFVVFVGIMILWRPTSNNRRYGLQELPSDDDDAFAPDSGEYREDIGFRHLGAENPEDEQFDAIFDIVEEHENFMEWAGDEDSSDESNSKKHPQSKPKDSADEGTQSRPADQADNQV
ncbi:hypothetical protein K493DRAFT_21642 [Basidiobolus meristosporus CBS 931.73]|uniref:Integral membrane protein n=1 Tax=Basidiobolus meristosporus CBS 931.73 TaxID=1314790 RepID=A0A1Y1YDE7_9FUNG|nr:hypothetical protein K493DRAFT_21642 [Basidiobolus meristosporus CBS 931.73]|eukprot:ORX95988.1 hypothetical protein K493DRAFT_21642 [Basidiobolus meristosporus CBS 931.73]